MLKKGLSYCLFFTVLTLGLFLFHTYIAEARVLPDILWDKETGLSHPKYTQGDDAIQKFNYFIRRVIIPNIKYIFAGVAILIGLYYMTQIVIATGSEDIDTQKKNLLWAAMGFGLLGVSMFVVDAFAPIYDATEIGKIQEVKSATERIISFVSWLTGGIAVLFISIAAIRIIVSQGNEEEINKQKTNFVWGFFGLIIILLANATVTTVYKFQTKTGKILPEGAQPGDIHAGGREIFALIKWVLQFLGITAIFSLVAAGIFYVVSMGDDEKTGKAKRIIFAVIVALVIIYSAYAFVATVLIGSSGG